MFTKESPIRTTIPSSAKPGNGMLWRHSPRRRVSSVSNWLKTIPFIALHVACIVVLFLPDFGLSITTLGLCAFTYFIRMFGITGGYHRYFAHRSFKTSRLMQFLLACLGCSSLQKGPLWWASNHRQHHRYSDTPDDPHSPRETSFWWAHVGWVLSKDHVETPVHVIRDLERYPELRWLDRYHWVPGILLAVSCYLFGALVGGWDGRSMTLLAQPAGWFHLVWGFVVSTVLLYHAVFSVNSVSHLLGARRYVTNDDSRNNLILALITLGDGWHNNHHHYQSSANAGFFWWEIDITYRIIRMLAFFGLVWGIRKPGEKVLTFRNIEMKRSGIV
jgi:stearoyl-CoA desaturase (Delta-9 desaturase)